MATKYLDSEGLRYLWTKIKATFALTTHTHSDYVPTTRTVNGKVLSSNITLEASDVGALDDSTTIPSAGTGSSYPVMDGTRALGSQAGYARVDHVHPSDTSRVPTTRTVNGKALSSNITLTASDVGADYSSGTQAQIESGTSTDSLLWTPKILHDYVVNVVQQASSGAVAYQGMVTSTFAPTNYTAGWYWIVGTAGTYAGQVCEAGDMIFCNTSASAYSASNFDVVQTNLDITQITNAEIDTIVAS